MTLEELISEYLYSKSGSSCSPLTSDGCSPNYKPKGCGNNSLTYEDTVIEYCMEAKHLKAAIKRAALCQDRNGKRHSHQYRIPSDSLKDLSKKLSGETNKIRKIKDFQKLYNVVELIGRPISMIGDLVIYDVAHRIGCYLGIVPEEVYLHAGTREGAINLLGNDKVRGKRKLPLSAFPVCMQKELSAADIENFLCSYKDELRKIK